MRSMQRLLFAIVVGCVTFSPATVFPQSTPPASRKNVPDQLEQIDSYLTNCQAYGWSGVVLIAKEGKVVLGKGYGMANRQTGRKNDTDTLFEIASISKVFTACAVMKLVEMGKVELDQSIASYLPGVPEDKKEITVRHLLTHMSGMSRSVGGGGETVEQAVQSYLGKPQSRRAGVRHEYWNGGYALLAGVIERVSGQSIQEFSRQHLFEPAGMKDSGFTGETTLPLDRQAIGYDGQRRLRTATDHPYQSFGFQYKGMGGVVTTANDLWRFSQALSQGKLLTKKTNQFMQTPVEKYQAIGWSIVQSNRDTPRVQHGGDVRGFHCSLEILPVEDVTIVVLSNVEGIPRWKVQWNVQSLLFSETTRYPLPPSPKPITPAELNRWEGRYRIAESDDAIIVRQKEGGLVVAADGPQATMALTTSDNQSDLETAIQQTHQIVDAAQNRDADFLRNQLDPDAWYADSWSKNIVTIIWPKEVEQWGELKETFTVGAVQNLQRQTTVVLRLQHAKRDRYLRAVFSMDKKLQTLVFDGPRFALERPYRFVGEQKFQTFDWNHDSELPAIRFQTNGDQTELIVNSATEIRGIRQR